MATLARDTRQNCVLRLYDRKERKKERRRQTDVSTRWGGEGRGAGSIS